MFKKIIALILVLLLAVPVLNAAADSKIQDVSPGIDWIRRNIKIQKPAVKGANVTFSDKVVEDALGVDITHICITSLPPVAQGRLCLNGTDVIQGQTVTAEKMSGLVFVPATGSAYGEFSITCGGNGWEDIQIPCSVTYFESKNENPSVSASAMTAISGIACTAELSVFEPDGDKYDVFVEKYPLNGSVKIMGSQLIYTPENGFSGTDTVKVFAKDIFGNASPSVEVEFNVTPNGSQIVFADMENNIAHGAAVMLAEKSVVTFMQKDGEYYFSPETAVSRIDFMVMLLSAAEIAPESDVEVSLEFEDISGVSSGKLAYVKKAADMGLIKLSDKKFDPDATVTRIQAAEWCAKLLELGVNKVHSFSDMKTYSENSRFYAGAVVEAGIFSAPENRFSPEQKLTKADAALILKAVMDKK